MNNQRRFGRPRLKRKIRFNPKVDYFKPQGIPMAGLEVVELSKEELEAMRLKNIKNLDQKECALAMNTSPATLQRILASAYNKISIALVEGRAIKIIKE
ncbi:MAG: DUF134 domain-containing protein [Patescibacteria group bacterium]|jgi:predicted DNA-binding protein (UPF0251 family)|nr:DUF134 domain-containing protein [Patescibacteria group bacterium]